MPLNPQIVCGGKLTNRSHQHCPLLLGHFDKTVVVETARTPDVELFELRRPLYLVRLLVQA